MSKFKWWGFKQSKRSKGWLYHHGRCNICGSETTFSYKDVALYRESLLCAVCLTTSRYRSIARGILRVLNEITGTEAKSLAELDPTLKNAPVTIYDTQAPFYWDTCSYPIPDLLSRCEWIEVRSSLYRPHEPLGISLGPTTSNQDLERLTYLDRTFDIVITSDVMEHVRRDDVAHREIRRVLKPSGYYIFTVPHFRHTSETLTRVAVIDALDPGKDRYLMEKEYHGDANAEDGRALSYRSYGTELDGYLEELGFHVEYCHDDFPEIGIMDTELFSCKVSAKGV
jgi:SAM-dependent methyltransferase